MTTVNRKLEMVNAVLIEIGESAVNSLDNIRSVKNIITMMDREKRRALNNKGHGYSFNRYDYKPVKDVNDQYILPENTLAVQTDGASTLSIRDNRLFNVSTNSYTDIYFTDLTLIMDIDYDDLPYLMDEYIVSCVIYRTKKAEGFAQNEINEAFGIRKSIEDELNEEEAYIIQQDPNNNRFRNKDLYTTDTARNRLAKI